MLLPSRSNFLDHYLYLQKSLSRHGAEAIISVENSTVLIRKNDSQLKLFAKFLVPGVDKVLHYANAPGEGHNIFAGWLPYHSKSWDIAVDKLKFKQAAESLVFRVPGYGIDSTEDRKNVLIKRARGSFGAQILGPFRSSQERPLDPSKGEYYEKFIPGRVVKIWFWNATPICLELETMPYVLGDGVTPLRELFFNRARLNRFVAEEELLKMLEEKKALFQYFGVDANDVLEKGKKQLIEFRYGSHLALPRNRVIRRLDPDNPIRALDQRFLFDLGPRLYETIPISYRENTLYTVDAVLDKEGKMAFLEMNSNPTVHPLVYPAMIDSLLATAR